MLMITIPSIEMYDELSGTFTYTKEHVLTMEHSLVSLSKWEAKWNRPFFSKDDKSTAETIDYMKQMTITQHIDESLYSYISNDNILAVQKYIEEPMTATTFSNGNNKSSREIITAEIIYFWMISLNIPFECQKWHLNKLLTLINVCSIKNTPPKKMRRGEVAKSNSSINNARKKAMNSSG